jgi:hypothetical protein
VLLMGPHIMAVAGAAVLGQHSIAALRASLSPARRMVLQDLGNKHCQKAHAVAALAWDPNVTNALSLWAAHMLQCQQHACLRPMLQTGHWIGLDAAPFNLIDTVLYTMIWQSHFGAQGGK